jgi:hypothetical protein
MSINDIANQLKAAGVWLRRIGHCRGFGIQSPSDYWLVRYVINEHWPYYQYERLGRNDDWLTRKQGRLCFRIANWRQPTTILTNGYQRWFQAGCRSAHILSDLGDETLQLAHIEIEQCAQLEELYTHCQQESVIIVEGIHRDWNAWHAIEKDVRVGTTFDLYYCGIVFFDVQRYKHHYRINF